MNLKVKIFADGADLAHVSRLASDPMISGFTTNPTLMRQAGVEAYESFAKEMLAVVGGRPVSFEVFSDEFNDMERQALKIASWGSNVFVKIPITNTKQESAIPLVAHLSKQGVRVNVTAIFTEKQIDEATEATAHGPGANVSVFAGRIADAGLDPCPYISHAVAASKEYDHVDVIWASPREVFNVVQADQLGCQIITVTPDILKKMPSLGKDLSVFSLETVQMFFADASAAGYSL